ncbi:MAG: P-loop NTPase [Nitrospirota bacterium]
MKSERRARRVAIVSGKGGVGKTMVAANLAAALAKTGHSVLVVDSDLGLANLDVMLGVQPSYTLHDVLHGVCALKDALVHVPVRAHEVAGQAKAPPVDGFDILPGGSGIRDATTLTASAREDLKALLHELGSRYEFLLCDAGAGIGEVVLFFAQIADDIVVVVTPEPTSLTDAYATIKVLARECGRTEVHMIVNLVAGATPEKSGGAVVSHLQQVASRFLLSDGTTLVRIHLLGVIPSDPAVPRAIARQQLLESAAPTGPATQAIALLADRLFAVATALVPNV